MKTHTPQQTAATPTLEAAGLAQRAPTADAASSVHAVDAGAALSQGGALALQTTGAGNSFAQGLSHGGEGDDGGGTGEPGVRSMGGFAARGTGDAAPDTGETELSDEQVEVFQTEVQSSFGTAAEGETGVGGGFEQGTAEATPGEEAPAADETGVGGGVEEGTAEATEAPEITVVNQYPGPDDGAWDRTVVGVGEGITFWATVDGGTWSSSGGTGTAGSSGEYEWTAPGDFATVTITYTLDDQTATEQIAVLAPMAITSTLVGANNDNQVAGQAGAGMDTSLTMQPTNVSFYNVEWLEDPHPVSAKSGYFDKVPDELLYHTPNENWIPMGADNNNITDTAAYWGAPAPFSEGSFTWVVPNRFRVTGQGGGRVFTPSVQHMTMDADGKAGVSKYNSSISRSP